MHIQEYLGCVSVKQKCVHTVCGQENICTHCVRLSEANNDIFCPRNVFRSPDGLRIICMKKIPSVFSEEFKNIFCPCFSAGLVTARGCATKKEVNSSLKIQYTIYYLSNILVLQNSKQSTNYKSVEILKCHFEGSLH